MTNGKQILNDANWDISKHCRNYIQWKGTDVCMDFHCMCGNSIHIDDDFVYAVKCLSCNTVWELGTEVQVTELTDKPDFKYGSAVTGDQDDDR